MDYDSDDDRGGDAPEFMKKRPANAQEALIQGLLGEEQARKKAKHQDGQAPPPQKKGKTFKEIEEEEGGPVKESLVGMAHVKRADARKAQEKKAMDDTEVPAEVEKFEEEAEVEEEDGNKFTAFNLKEERETGYFDDEGNYVERKDKGDVKDAWMASDEAKVVSAEVRKKIEQRQKVVEATERRAPLTDRQIATFKAEIAGHMQRGETIAKALKRLGGANAAAGKALGKREKQRLQQQQAAEGGAGEGTGAAAGAGNSGPFMRMVEIADLLVEEGEMDVYDATKEDLERSAAMWLPKQAVQAAGAGAGAAAGGSGAAGKAAAAADDDDDMFASEDAADDKAAKAGAGAQAGAGAAGAKQGEAAAVEAGDGTDYASWPVKELKRFLQERGEDASAYVEKGDMVKKVKELAAKGPVVAEGSKAPGAFQAPPGFAFDPTSGQFYSTEHNMYFDTSSGCYYRGSQWFTFNAAAGQFVPWR